jgi:hypothetical protein
MIVIKSMFLDPKSACKFCELFVEIARACSVRVMRKQLANILGDEQDGDETDKESEHINLSFRNQFGAIPY